MVEDLREVVKRDVLVVLLVAEHETLLALVVEHDLTLVCSVADFLDVPGIQVGNPLLNFFGLLGGSLDGSLLGGDLLLDELELLVELGKLSELHLPSAVRTAGYGRPPC